MTQFKGSITALATPFRGGDVDEKAFVNLVERQIAHGTHGVVPVGTTGESATLTEGEHERVIRLCVEAVDKRIPVIAGAGANDTRFAIKIAQQAQSYGANAILAVTGYYNRPSQEGVYAHYAALHDATDLPIILYNVPSRTAVNISVETLGRLAELPRIVGVKDATGDLARVPLQRAACGDDYLQISGEDMTAVGFNAMGGVGCISVCANVTPDLCAKMQEATLNGEFDVARKLQNKLAPLIDALFADVNPSPVKYALSALGLCTDEMRLPLTSASQPARAKVDAALTGLGLLG